MALTPATGHKMTSGLMRGERHLFSTSDDSMVMKQITGTHLPDGRDIDVKPLLRVVEDILHRATPTVIVTPPTHMEHLEDRVNQGEAIGMLEALAYTIHKISCEITCKCSGSGSDAHATTMVLLNQLSCYDWDAKVVLAMAAFAVSYGEFWLTAQLYTINPLAKSVALLKQLPDIIEHTEILKPRFDAVNHLIKAMLDVTRCVIEFKQLSDEFTGTDWQEMSTAQAHIPTAVYWTIRSIVACSSQIIGLIGLGHEYISSTTEAWELSSLAHKLNNIHGHLKKELDQCRHHIEEKQHLEAFQALVRLFDTIHIDNIKILRALFYSKDEHPLIDGSTKKRVSVEVLRRKIVMLFVSDLDISNEELFVLIQIYNDTHGGNERRYEVVWLPIMDRHQPWGPAKEEGYNRLASNMPWHYMHNPTMIDHAVVRYVRQAWHFDKKPMLVVLDPQGKMVCPNALHMMWIWGSLAFPFTSAREEALWKDETWRLELLVDEIDPLILSAIRDDRFVCLYGGEDMEWIRRFTSVMRRIAQEAGIPLDMVYVGKSNPKEKVRKAMTTISSEKLSGYWQDATMVWFFWVRLESMLHSKMQLHDKPLTPISHNDDGTVTVEDDPILNEVMSLLSFDSGGHPWAVISHGSLNMVRSDGRKLLECLGQFDTWKDSIETEGFVPALRRALEPYHTHEHCTRLILPGDAGRIKERVICAECKKPMERFVLYQCCND
ncbi:hypothetical protein LUZ60_013545 [Juncus effusus]|nr:hypothetical protein LUZ60_013545 [Juncus effusus]